MTTKQMMSSVSIALGMCALVGAGTWAYVRRQSEQSFEAESLRPIVGALTANRRIISDLQTAEPTLSEADMLDEYLSTVRSKGPPAGADLKRQIDMLVDNNIVIMTLLSQYASHARLQSFRTAAQEFRLYAESQRSRWHSVFEVFMAGGNLPDEGAPYPVDFARAVDAELAAY